MVLNGAANEACHHWLECQQEGSEPEEGTSAVPAAPGSKYFLVMSNCAVSFIGGGGC